MSDPLKPGQPPDDVLPYAPNWARNPGYRPSQPNIGYDAFSEEENPSYRSMAQMFSPDVERAKKRRPSSAGKMLLRFGAVVGIAGAALALFIGYVVTQPESDTTAANKERFEGVNNAVSAIQAALSPSKAPAATASGVLAVETVPVKPAVAKDAAKAPSESVVSSDRGAAPSAPPADTNLAPEASSAPTMAPAAPEPPTQMAALPPKDTPPAPPPAPLAPQLTAGELTTLMARGRRFIESGDFSSARPVYRRAAEAGYAEAALALGETYDPVTLRERGVVGLVPDVKKAREWYERARELGSLEAPTRLDRLPRN
jgi:hypothetical protein